MWEGVGKWMSDLFYRAVIQVVLLFGLDSGVLSEVITRMVESTNVGLLRHITGKQAICQYKRSWETPVAMEVIQTEGMNSEATYIGLKKATVAQWVAL